MTKMVPKLIKYTTGLSSLGRLCDSFVKCCVYGCYSTLVATVVLLRQAELLQAKQTLSLLSYSRKKQLSHSLTVLLQKSDLTKAVKFSIWTEMASSLNTTPSGSKGATPSSSSLNRLSTASTEGKTEGSKLRSANPSQYVKLNVGGSLHYTTIGTLTKVDNTSYQTCVICWKKNLDLFFSAQSEMWLKIHWPHSP